MSLSFFHRQLDELSVEKEFSTKQVMTDVLKIVVKRLRLLFVDMV